MKKNALFTILFIAQTAYATQNNFNINPLEVGALVGKFGVASLEDEGQKRALLLSIAAFRFYQAFQRNQRNTTLGTMIIENALVVFGKDLFIPKKESLHSFSEQDSESNNNWTIFWKLLKADLFGALLGHFCCTGTYGSEQHCCENI